MPTERLLTSKEAADLLGCSVDTVRRRERKVYANADLVGGVTLIPLSDLVAAGHYTPRRRRTSPRPSPASATTGRPSGCVRSSPSCSHLSGSCSRSPSAPSS